MEKNLKKLKQRMLLHTLARKLLHFHIVPLFHRLSRRAAPVHDGKQEGGQHVFYDLVHQLVLNWSWYRTEGVNVRTTEGEGG